MVIDLLAGWRNWLGKHSSNIWNWYHNLWCELFGGSVIIVYLEHTGDQLITLFVGTLFDWSLAWGFTSKESIMMFLVPCT